MRKNLFKKSIATAASVVVALQLAAAPMGLAWADELEAQAVAEQAVEVEVVEEADELTIEQEAAEAETVVAGKSMLEKDETAHLLTAEDGTGIEAVDGVYTIDAAGTYTYTGSGSDIIRIDGVGATLKLSGVAIEAKGMSHSALEVVNGAQATLIIEGSCTLVGDVNQAGIQVDSASSLHITGAGSLKAVGNGNIDYSSTADGKAASYSNGAGIGGTSSSPDAGAISIDGQGKALTVSAIGGGKGAAGIGAGYSGSASTIQIDGANLAGVHGGCHGAIVEGDAAYAKSTLEGGAAIGGGTKGAAGGTIRINDCTGSDIVGGGKAAGIGGGCWATAIDVAISGSTLQVEGGTSGAAIGSGRAFENVALNVDIDSSSIVANGGALGAGIGTGVNGSNRDLEIATVDITGSTVTATGGAGAAGIGGGVRAYNVSVSIDGASTVTAYAGANYLAKYTEKYNDAGLGQSGAAAIGRGSWGSVSKFADRENALDPTLAISADSTVTAFSSGDNLAIAGFTNTEGVASTIMQTRFVRNYDLAGKNFIDRAADEGMGEDWAVCYLDGAASTNLIVKDAETNKPVATVATPAAGADFANGYEGSGRLGYYSVAMTLPSAGTFTVNTDSAVRTMDRLGDELITSDMEGYLGGATYWEDGERTGKFECATGVNTFDRMGFRIAAAPEPEPVNAAQSADEIAIDEDSVDESGAIVEASAAEPAANAAESSRAGILAAPAAPSTPSAPTAGGTGSGSDISSAPSEVTIDEAGTPLAGSMGHSDQCWIHWVMFFGIILTALYSLGVVAYRANHSRKIARIEAEILASDEEELEPQKRTGNAPVIRPTLKTVEA